MAIIPRIKSVILQYSNFPPPMRGMNGIHSIVYGGRTGGTCDFYRRGHDSSFGGCILNPWPTDRDRGGSDARDAPSRRD